MTQTVTRISGLTQYLIEQKLIDASKIRKALVKWDKQTTPVELLLKHNLLTPLTLAKASARYYSLPLIDLDTININAIPKRYLNNSLVQNRKALPLEVNERQLKIAVVDPSLPNLNEIIFYSNLNPKLVIAPADKLTNLIDQLLNERLYTSFLNISNEELETSTEAVLSTADTSTLEYTTEFTEAPLIVKYVYKLLLQAVQQHASDIHFEPYEQYYRVRYRKDGVLYEISKPPFKITNYIVARLKIMANLDIAEHRLPQDGRFRLNFANTRPIDFRISTCPTMHGEKIVVRILDDISILGEIADLGMESEQLKAFEKVIHQFQGMILVTGPTGSGKTTTLYTVLKTINQSEYNICTVEDPIEINLNGINQVAVNAVTGLTFSKALRAFLRQDPDVIMVGEIRDLETAEVSVRAAQTGHLVLSTLHTNSASETLVRLANMGIPNYNIASAITLILAQRLIRKLCNDCKEKIQMPLSALVEAGFDTETAKDITLYEPKGCANCSQGFQGRFALFEVMPINKSMAELIMSGANALEIARYARKQGIKTLREHGLKKVKQGLTSLAEINRIIS